MPKTRPTMLDVAREASVSLMTVSRVVNNSANVDEKLRERVQTAITQLGFRRNDLARTLRQGSATGVVGLVIEDIANPFYSSIARGVEEAARERGYMVVSGSHGKNTVNERDLALNLLRGRAEGLLMVPVSAEHQYLADEVALGTPVVFLDRPANDIDADAVLLDNRGGAQQGIMHLLAQGFRRIALVGGDPTVFTDIERLQGYRDAHAAYGVAVDERLVRLRAHDTIQAEAVTAELLSLPEPPDAIFANNNRMSVGVLNVCHQRHLLLPIVGFDDIELAHLLAMPITVVKHNPIEMGRQAAQLLFARLDGDTRPFRRIIIPTELVVRTTGRQGTDYEYSSAGRLA